MAADNKTTLNTRRAMKIGGLGAIGVIAGAFLGYLGYSYPLISNSPLINIESGSKDSAFDQTYRSMVRLAGLEAVAGACDGKSVPLAILEREGQVIEQIDLNSKKADLYPPLNVARAIVSYRRALLADGQSDKQMFDSLIEQETAYLRAAGWKDTSHAHLVTIIQNSDGCTFRGTTSQERDR